ncbi:hypothetical protein CSUI_004310 [Cystoisospora suis]|uniref:Uncharacterized protein n=1 Tax=Cystoisospora suis TaxID=483139 RepID=A0A2C6KC57_9APIC|nr:hypothetical protein CSUI_004310 [Cystoisospora suis]
MAMHFHRFCHRVACIGCERVRFYLRRGRQVVQDGSFLPPPFIGNGRTIR